tara:strand:+ start:44 stop:517 length:474 start_codon:yes stop_codon:yes gene_type:complete
MTEDADKPRPTWIQYALKIATVAAERSEDPFQKVGACLLRHDNSVAAVGYNGAPSGVELDWTNRDQRRVRVIHAEVNALRYVEPGECYLLACTLLPCNDCLKAIASYGIGNIAFDDVYNRDKSSLDMAKEFGITLYATPQAQRHMEAGYDIERIDGI